MEQARQPILALAGQVIAGYQLDHLLTNGAIDARYLSKRMEKNPAPIARRGLAALPLPEQALCELFSLPERRSQRVTQLQRELPKLQQLTHPGLLPLLRCGEDAAHAAAYAIYPYPAGGSVADRLHAAHGAPLAYTEINAILSQVAAALDAAHQRGYLHLHLRPETLLLDSKNGTYLASIGVAQALDLSSVIASGSLYAAPEQITRDPVSPATDVYSLGMVLYQMITGRTAFESTRHQLQSPPPPSQYRADLPAQIETVILQAISSYPAQRYATAGFLAREFAEAVQNTQLQSNAKGIEGDGIQGPERPGAVGVGGPDDPTLPGTPVLAVAAAPVAAATSPTASSLSTPSTPTASTPVEATPTNVRRAPNSKSFRVSTPASTGNTLYPPRSTPEWQVPSDFASPQLPTRTLLPAPAPAAAPVSVPARPAKAQSTTRRRRKRRSWSISIVLFLIVLVSLAIIALLFYPQLNGKVTLPFLPAQIGHSSSSTHNGSGSFATAAGTNLYKTVTPGSCDKAGATWVQNFEAVQTCGASGLDLNAPTCQDCPLGVVALLGLVNGKPYPTSYAVQVTVQPLATDPTIMFGIKFRQQSQLDDGQGRGGYSYLVNQNGQWEFDEYAADGTKQTLAQGQLAKALPANAVLGLVVNGSTYDFYLNGKRIATERDTTYSTGYLCLVAAPGATILFSQFALAQLA